MALLVTTRCSFFTSDEGDHFVGGPPSPANCDGVTIPCSYAQIGEISANLAGLKVSQFLADSVEMKILHMVTADPARTPSLVMFAIPITSSSPERPTATHPA
jgi:hypothetical protein